MAILNLPPFAPSAEFPIQPDPGKWANADGTLKQLGRALRVNREKAFRDPDEAIRAIPDPWAQARTFGEALLDSAHSMHARSLTEWRGLLALFALQKFYTADYRIEPRQIDLNGPHIFDRVLAALPPEVAIRGQAGLWAKPWLLLVSQGNSEGQALGLSNPICLVSPGRSSHLLTLKGVAWAQGSLGDPLALAEDDGLPAPQIVALRDWLKAVDGDLAEFPGPVCARIRELLGEYARACVAVLGEDVALEAAIGATLRTDLPTLYRPLFRPAELPTIGEPESTSQTMLRLREGLDTGGLKGVILADPSVAELHGLSPRICLVWGLCTLAEVLRSEGRFKEVAEAAGSRGYLLIRASDLFTDRAVRLTNEPFIRSHPQGLQDMLLPLRPLALLLANNLRDGCSAQAAANRVAVTLTVKLARPNGHDASVDITQHYAVEPGKGEKLFIPSADWDIHNASTWPNFRSDAWDTYLTRFFYDIDRKGKMARPHRALSAEQIADELRHDESPIARVRALNDREMPNGNGGGFRRSERARDKATEEMQFAKVPFEALAYLEGQGTRSEAPAGLVLIDLPTIAPAHPGTTIAVDFGTTNTVACLEANEEAPPVRFQERLIFPIKYKSSDRTTATLHSVRHILTRFLPPEERVSPSPTVAVERTPYPANEPLWAFCNLIYFHPSQQYAENDEEGELRRFGRLAKGAKFNLKWSGDPAIAEAATHFLEQFMVMASAEALAAGHDPRLTRWRFSVPDAMSRQKREDFEGYLSNTTRRISSNFVERSGQHALDELYSEGLAAARYMISAAGFNASALNLVLDIGGGTTDVTIWDREDLKWRGSFQIAGQNFFTKLICNNPTILREIGLGGWAGLFESLDNLPEGIRREDVPHLAEMLFSGTSREFDGHDLQRAIDMHWATRLNGRVGAPLRIAGLVFIAGLAWYLGRIVKKLIADGVLDEQIASRPAFSLCGRGAGLFKKIHGDRRPDQESVLTRALTVFGKAAELNDPVDPEIRTTHLAKLEVVRGMLADDALIDATVEKGSRDVARFQLAGLELKFRGGGELRADAVVGETAIENSIDHADLAELNLFLNELLKRADLKIDLLSSRSSGAAAFIADQVRKDIELARKEGAARRPPEPPFITALRQLVAEIAANSKKREGRIGMEFVE